MADTFSLVDSLALGDLQVFLGRAARIDDGSVRLIGGSGVLAVYVAVLHPVGLLDEVPTVLGLRTFALSGGAGAPGADPAGGAAGDALDVVVPIRSLLARLESVQDRAAQDVGSPVTVTLPAAVSTVTWAAISPPRGGWHALPNVDGAALESAARSGIEEIAAALPQDAGQPVVQKLRSEVWGRPLPDHDHIPAGAGFAAVSLGFLGESDTVSVFESGPWTRLTTKRGHVLIKRRAWTLAR